MLTAVPPMSCGERWGAGASGVPLGQVHVQDLVPAVSEAPPVAHEDEFGEEQIEVAVEPVPREAPDSRPAPRPVVERPWGIGLFAAGGIMLRGTPSAAAAVDGVAELGGVIGLVRGFGAGLTAQLVPSSNAGLEVIDTVLSAGPAFSLPLGQRTVLTPSVQAGVWISSSRFLERRRAYATDFAVSVPVRLRVTIVGGLGVTLSAFAGYASRTRRHTLRGRVLWERRRFRGGLTTGLSYHFGVGG